MEEKNILIDKLKINYKIAEEGKPLFNFAGIKILPTQPRGRGTILILHGWGGSSDSWVKVQEILAGQGFKVIVPDFPGFGKSVPPPIPWGVSDYASFLRDFAEQLEIQDFCLLGHSFGGRVAVKFITLHPERVKSLILCDSAGIKPKPGFKTLIIFWLARIGNSLFTPKHLQRFKDSIKNLFYIFLRNRDYAKVEGVMKETIKKVLEEDLISDLSKIKRKTLIVWGSADKMVPVKYARIFKEKIEDSELEILPKIGHSPHLEVPERLAESIIKFITNNKPISCE